MTVLNLILISFYGLLIGSFLNVCIYRIPRQENIVLTKSHCMSCGYQLRWYDLIPLFSYLFLGGRCRKCKTRIFLQYPMIEALNAVLYVVIFWINGSSAESVIYCLMTSTLIVISVIDFKTYQIPIGCNGFLLFLGGIHLVLDYHNWVLYIIGMGLVSGFLLILYLLTKGKGMGGGDIKLMAAAGLILGWKLILLALFWGSILASVIHLLRMAISKQGHVLAFGPYLSMGIFLASLFGNQFYQWYFSLIQ